MNCQKEFEKCTNCAKLLDGGKKMIALYSKEFDKCTKLEKMIVQKDEHVKNLEKKYEELNQFVKNSEDMYNTILINLD